GPMHDRKKGAEETPDGNLPLARLTQHDRYRLKKYWRTNQDTAINQRPLVAQGQKGKPGASLADGAATEQGQLALGANVTVAFMPWYGHNFEDAIVLSERLVKDDVYSSIHIQELELQVRDTKRGQEEITREIPNVSEEALLDLDERGIVRIGAHVKPGDILVGKITPKGETELSPEEKLLTAIFGEKAKDVKDSSLKVPPGMEGVVIDVKIFSRIEDQVVEKDRGERIGDIRRLEGEEKIRVNEVRDAELMDLLDGQTVSLALKAGTVEEAIPAGTKLSAQMLRDLKMTSIDLKTFRVEDKKMNERVRTIIDLANEEKAKLEEKAEERIDRVLQPDELPPGVIQLVKVYMAEKRKVSVGDKMAGRHGNKGIVARIVPEEDMPFLPDGRPVDIVLNPLGVPSRMNIGQVLETHLGWAAAHGVFAENGDRTESTDGRGSVDWKHRRQIINGGDPSPVATPVFDGATPAHVDEALIAWAEQNPDSPIQFLVDKKRAKGRQCSGKVKLYNGRTGEPFEQKITVGYMDILQLLHLVDDKTHARSTGPYSLVTQQPLGGKAQFGGQRFGEMEVWALEAYGAAYTLQEMLT